MQLIMKKLIFIIPLFCICCNEQTEPKVFEESNSIASKIKTYSYKDLEFLNNEKNIVKDTPSYNRFKDNDSISIKWELRNDLNKINDFHKLDSISFNYSNGKLIINHIFFSQGNCLDFFPIFKINSTTISINTPVVIEIDPDEYFNSNSEIAESVINGCELASVVETSVSLLIDTNYRSKEIFYNSKKIK